MMFHLKLMDSFYFGVLAFAFCVLLLPVVIAIAEKFGLIDQPSGRKQHQLPTPMVGGITIYLAVLVSALIASDGLFNVTLLAWFGLVLVIGVLDDLFDVSYRIRLLAHACTVSGIFLTSGLVVGDVGAITGSSTVQLVGFAAVFFTMIGVIGVVNAVNMSDGADGLLGGLTLISLLTILWFALGHESTEHQIAAPGIAVLVGALTAFLLFNSRIFKLRRALVFMGDAGSTMLGFILAYLLINYSQGPGAPISPVVAGWIVGLPLLDASGVILNRVFYARSPFHPDRSHMHHVLMDSGFSVNQTVLTLVSVHTLLIFFSVTIFEVVGTASEVYLFWGFIVLVLLRAAFAQAFTGWVTNTVRQPPKAPDVSEMVGATSVTRESCTEQLEESSVK